MRLKAEQLEAALKKNLAPVYLIAGDEPLQLGEAADAIRRTAKKAGFENREVLTVDPHFEWASLGEAADSFSIFADKKIIDLRLPSGKPGAEGSKALSEYCARLPEDTLLLITSGKLDSASLKSKWAQTLDKTGIIIQIWPPSGQDLINWLQNRMANKGLFGDREGLRLLAGRVEGNLLAAAQEIEKLFVLHGPKQLSRHDIESAVADSSRYDVFNLCDAMLAGKTGRILKMLQGLKSEGTAEPLVLWALTRDIRLLISIKTARCQGFSKDQALRNAHVWENRKGLVLGAEQRLKLTQLNKALLMSTEADRRIKGASKGNAWDMLTQICLLVGGAEVMAETT